MTITLGKKCPTCGNKALESQSSTSSRKTLGLKQTYFCTRCRQQVQYFFPCSVNREKRAHPRRQMPVQFLIRIHGKQHQYGRIKNISPGGVCFQYEYSSGLIQDRFLTLDLYNCSDGSSLEQLAVELVSTSEKLTDTAGSRSTVLQHCARFVRLNQAQAKVLSACIERYGTPEPRAAA